MVGARQCEAARSFPSWRALLGQSEGSALAEFAIALPLLVVLVVGIFDFGAAFNTKQELNNAVREGARFGAAQPTNDLCGGCTAPLSIDAIRVFVASYLKAAGINDCGLSGMVATGSSSGPPWEYDASSNGCAGTLKFVIARDPSSGPVLPAQCSLSAPGYGSVNVVIPCTKVSISYPYQWHFNSVIQLLVPGATYAGVTQIPTDATAINMD